MNIQSKFPTKKMSFSKSVDSEEFYLFESLKLIVDWIAKTFGSRCEVVLHDLRNPKNFHRSIIKIANGHITGRDVGGPLSDHGLIQHKLGFKENPLINYPSETKDGRLLKSSSVIFHDKNKNPIASLCINFDISDVIEFNEAIQEVFAIFHEDKNNDNPVETFQGDAVTTLNEIADKTFRNLRKAVPSMKKKDKIAIVRQLDEKGFFLVKGAIKIIASKLNVSKYTIYNYLDEIRNNQKDDVSIV